jgi:hypothetical protein
MKIRFGVCDWTIEKSGDPAALEVAAGLGLEGVQVSLIPKGDSLVLLDKSAQEAYLAAARKSGASIASFCIGRLNSVPLQTDPRAERWVAEDRGRLDHEVGPILVPFFGPADLKQSRRHGVGRHRPQTARPKARKAGVTLALEMTLSAEDNLRSWTPSARWRVRLYDVRNSRSRYDIGQEIRLLGAHLESMPDTKDLFGRGR